MDAICEQIIKQNYNSMNDPNVSLILDGGTVFHTKWLGIGKLARNNFEMIYQFLDVLVFAKSTTSAIRECINNIAGKFRWQRRSVFGRYFIEKDGNEDFMPFNIMRVSCACHIIQLVFKDLYDDKLLLKRKEKEISTWFINIFY